MGLVDRCYNTSYLTVGRKDEDFGSLLSKVNFVLSGFKNPFRGQLRDKAVVMGAQYDPDWGPTSTHLV